MKDEMNFVTGTNNGGLVDAFCDKSYSTRFSRKIGYFNNNLPLSDRFVEHTLFKTKEGEYLLLSEGGPLTIYRKVCDDGSFGFGKRITRMSEEDAKEWMKKHETDDAYTDVFGKENVYDPTLYEEWGIDEKRPHWY